MLFSQIFKVRTENIIFLTFLLCIALALFSGNVSTVNAAANSCLTLSDDGTTVIAASDCTVLTADDWGTATRIADGISYTRGVFYKSGDTLRSIEFPSNFEYIGNYAFYNCTKLSGSLIIPDSVTSIGSSAFYNCSGFTGNLVIPNSVTSIGSSAFYNCSGFTGNLVIPNSVTSIGSSAFSGCSGFTGDLVISNSVTSIGDSAFSGCSGFTGDLVISNSVTSIGSSAFRNCSGFTGNLVIQDSVTSIGSSAFYGCSGFTGDLVIPDSVTSIGSSAFSGCSGFTGDLVIPNSVTSIERYAFSGCSGFTGDLTIGDVLVPNGETIPYMENIVIHLTAFDNTPFYHYLCDEFDCGNTANINVTKRWDDLTNTFNTRSSNLNPNITLYAVGEETVSFGTVTGSGTFYGVPVYDASGSLVTYTVREQPEANGYKMVVKPNNYFTIPDLEGSNVRALEVHNVMTKNITVKKIWDDENNESKRPQSITFDAYDNDSYTTVIGSCTADASTSWECTIENLPAIRDYKYDVKGSEAHHYYEQSYYIKERTVNGYESEPVAAPGFNECFGCEINPYSNTRYDTSYYIGDTSATITNTLVGLSTMSISIQKIWQDDGDRDHYRPSAICVRLLDNGEQTEYRTELSGSGNVWEYTFQDVPISDNYTIEETGTTCE